MPNAAVPNAPGSQPMGGAAGDASSFDGAGRLDSQGPPGPDQGTGPSINPEGQSSDSAMPPGSGSSSGGDAGAGTGSSGSAGSDMGQPGTKEGYGQQPLGMTKQDCQQKGKSDGAVVYDVHAQACWNVYGKAVNIKKAKDSIQEGFETVNFNFHVNGSQPPVPKPNNLPGGGDSLGKAVGAKTI